VDYGCVQELTPFHRKWAVEVHKAALARDEKTFRENVKNLVGAKPGRLADLALDYTRTCFEPLFTSPYRMKRDYAASLVSGMKSMAKDASKVSEAEFFTMPPHMLFLNRLQFGFYSVLARLDVDVDYARVESAFLEQSP
jgi:hypothetical protein